MTRLLLPSEFGTSRPRLPLSGLWEFSLDPDEKGIEREWHLGKRRLPETEMVPGCAQRRPHKSAGNADTCAGAPDGRSGMLRYPAPHTSWWATKFFIPCSWDRGRAVLHIGGALPSIEAWLNGVPVFGPYSTRAPLRLDVADLVTSGAGRANSIVVRLRRTGRELDGVLDWLGWSGLYRPVWIELVSDEVAIEDIHVMPSLRPAGVKVEATVTGRARSKAVVEFAVFDSKGRLVGSEAGRIRVGNDGRVAAEGWIRMANSEPWTPETPCLYELRAAVRVHRGGKATDSAAVRFGLREIRADGTRILLNGRPVFLRGGCDDHFYPHTVCPPADRAFFRDRIRRAKACGFNYTKSCVDVFTEEFMAAADEEGYLVCQEMPFGLHGEARERRYDPPPWFVEQCRMELARWITFDRNHPCVGIYSMASELDDRWVTNASCFNLFSRDLPLMARQFNPGALVMDCTGASCNNPTTGANAVAVNTSAGRRNTDLDGSWLAWAQTYKPLNGRIPGLSGVRKPFIFHEHAWITALSDPGLVGRYRGLPVKPLGIPEMVRAARGNCQARIRRQMVWASRLLKYALAKDAVELARREPKAAGYHYWLAHDFPFCAEGVLDDFWLEAPEMPAETFRLFNSETVLLLDDRDRRDFEACERPRIGLSISHFGRDRIRNPKLMWLLLDDERIVQKGEFFCGAIQTGTVSRLVPDLGISMPESPSAMRLVLKCVLSCGQSKIAENRWNLWVFPKWEQNWRRDTIFTCIKGLCERSSLFRYSENPPAKPQRCRSFVADRITDRVMDFLEGGGAVLFFCRRPPGQSAGEFEKARGEPLYRTVPYNRGEFGNMGTLVRNHEALGRLPHDGWCDFCFANLIHGAWPVLLDPFRPARIMPIIRSIGHMATMEDKAYMFEIAVSSGILLVCSLRIVETLEQSPLSRHILRSMLAYLAARPRLRGTGLDRSALARAVARRPQERLPGA